MPRSSSGLGHLVFSQRIRGSTPLRGTDSMPPEHNSASTERPRRLSSPLVLSPEEFDNRITDDPEFAESVAGFTTTGASILKGIFD